MNALTLKERIRLNLQRWNGIARARRDLKNMSDHMLKDIGLSRVDAERIASRPFWNTESGRDVTLRREAQMAGATCLKRSCCPQA